MKHSLYSVLAFAVLAAFPVAAADTARYILPPGNFGGMPFNVHSTDQLPLYSGLTPLRDNITPADIDQLLPARGLPADRALPGGDDRAGPGFSSSTTRTASRTSTDETRADVSFGAGWATARDRGLLLQVGRGPARVAVADVPNIDAFSLVTSAQAFVPEPGGRGPGHAAGPAPDRYVRQRGPRDHRRRPGLCGRRQRLLGGAQHPPADLHGERRRRRDGVHRVDLRRRRRRRGRQFGSARQAPAAARRRPGLQGLGRRDAGRRPRGADHHHQALQLRAVDRARPVQGSVVLDPDSIQSIDPQHAVRELRRRRPARRRASNFLVTAPSRSATGNSLAVMGPQLGYYYPEIVQQIDLHGPGFNAQGAAVPGPRDVHPDRAHAELRVEPDLGRT